jgi:hypothetical protein
MGRRDSLKSVTRLDNGLGYLLLGAEPISTHARPVIHMTIALLIVVSA